MDDLNPHRELPGLRPVQRETVRVRKPLWRRLLWLVLILLVIGGVAWWIAERPAKQPQTGRFGANGAPMPVVPATVQTGDIDIIFNALGTVTPLATVTVQTQINGQLTEIGFQEGQMVKKGDFLAQIDPRPYQAALDQAQGQLLHDQGLLKEAQVDLARFQKLAAQNSIAQQTADDQAFLVQQDEGMVKSDQAAVETAQLNLAYCHIVAPVAGRVGLRLVDAGNYIQVSSTTGIVVLTQIQPISVIFTLPEDNLPQLLKQLHGNVKLPVTIYDRSGAQKLDTGAFSAIDNEVDTTTGMVRLRAQFDNKDDNLFPNQFVNAQVLVDTLHNVVVMPTSAVQRGAPGTFVYLIKPDDTVTVQKVKLGPQEGERVTVESGLSVGDKVVVDGADKLRDGAKVTLHQENGSTASAAPAAASGGQPGQASSPMAAPTPQQPTPQQPTAQQQPDQPAGASQDQPQGQQAPRQRRRSGNGQSNGQ